MAWTDPGTQNDLKKTPCFVNWGEGGSSSLVYSHFPPAPYLAPISPSLLLSPLLISSLTVPSPWQLETASFPAPTWLSPGGEMPVVVASQGIPTLVGRLRGDFRGGNARP